MSDARARLEEMAQTLYDQGEVMIKQGKAPSGGLVGILCGLAAAKVLLDGGTTQDAWGKVIDVQLGARGLGGDDA